MDKLRQDALSRLARETSREKRQALLDELAKVFHEPAQAGQRELQEVGEALARIIPVLELADRAHLAERIAPAKEAPTYLVRMLALDEPEVAGPILAKSPTVVDQDLLACIQRGGNERLAAIARRAALSKQVQSALLASGNAGAILALLTNRALTLSSAALSAALTLARRDERIAAIVVERPDVPIGPLAELFFGLPTQGRIKLLAALGARQEPPPRVDEPTDETMAELLDAIRAGGAERLTALLVRAFDIPREKAERVLADETCEAFAVLALGASLPRALYSTFVVLSQAGEASKAALALYETVPVAGARRLLSHWQHGETRPALTPPRAEPARPVAAPSAPNPAEDPRRPRFSGFRRTVNNPGKR
ncbi:MAG: DUF2336 domain-containing protein [Alphaproteobacteria bacterium]